MKRPLLIVSIFALILSTAGGCNAIVNVKDQCVTDSDCANFGYEFTCQSSVCVGAAVPCHDAAGLAGHGCFQTSVAGCTNATTGPTVHQSLNACTDAVCAEPAPLTIAPSTPPPPPSQPPMSAQEPIIDLGTNATPCSIFGKPVALAIGSPTGAVLMSELSTAVNPRIVVAYIPMSSCDALSAAAQGTPLPRYAWYWDPVFTAEVPNARRLCKLADDVTPSIVVSDVDQSTCDATLPAALSAWQPTLGPVSYVTVAVHNASSLNAITQEVASAIFGFGADPMLGVNVAPFTNPAAIFMDGSVGWLVPSLAGKRIGYGTWKADSTDVAAAVAAANAAEAIGMMRGDAADFANLRPVAFRSNDQGCALLPDSSRGQKDRLNVRDGHYPLWFNSRLFTRLTGGAADPHVQAILDTLAGKALADDLQKTRPTWDVFARYAARHVIPSCAMKVRKTDDADFGALTSFVPPLGCGCHMDEVLGLPTRCLICKSDAECPATTVCAPWGTSSSTRYCEAKAP